MLSNIRRFSTSPVARSIKISSRDAPGNLTKLSVVVANAGSKSGKSGVAHLLTKFNFLNTTTKSALRFTRESELLGGSFGSVATRDNLILNAQFLKEDLPFYVESLGNVLAQTSFRPHEFVEIVLPAARAEFGRVNTNAYQALQSLHEISFRKGLGNPLYYDGTTSLTIEDVQTYATESYTAGNISIFASGASSEDLTKFVGESAFSTLPEGTATTGSVNSFKGKESRIRSSGESIALIGVPVKVADFAKYELLSAISGSSVLGGSSPLSEVGASSFLYKYSGAGLFVVEVRGSAAKVAAGIKQAKKIIDSASASAAGSKAAELAVALQSTFEVPLEFKEATLVGSIKEFNYVVVGDVDALPYANEL